MAEHSFTLDEAFELAVTYHQDGNLDDAETVYRKILDVNSGHVPSLGNLGIISKQRGDLAAAERFFSDALVHNPSYVGARFNLGVVYQETGRVQDALACYQQVREARPDDPDIHYNLGNLHGELGAHRAAIASYEQAIQLDPEHVEAHLNLGMKLLLVADFDRGFQEYEWRNRQAVAKAFRDRLGVDSPVWHGDDLDAGRLLVIAEQGLGDTIQFARYVYLLHEQAPGRIVFMTHPNLAHLFADSPFETLTFDNTLPAHDCHVMLMSLPRLFHVSGQSFPPCVDYIPASTRPAEAWRDKLAGRTGFKVGINWQGSRLFAFDRSRSIALRHFAKLFDVPGAEIISLQRGDGTEQLADFEHAGRMFTELSDIDIADEVNAFEQSVGLLRQLDLVITSCTALAHLSSTMGIRTWVVLSVGPDWRWFLESAETPWYENTRLYRQTGFGAWSSVFDRITADLRAEIHEI